MELARDEIVAWKRSYDTLCVEVMALRAQLEDTTTQAVFWKQAAEQACDMLNKLEDEHELLKDTLRALVREERLE